MARDVSTVSPQRCQEPGWRAQTELLDKVVRCGVWRYVVKGPHRTFKFPAVSPFSHRVAVPPRQRLLWTTFGHIAAGGRDRCDILGHVEEDAEL